MFSFRTRIFCSVLAVALLSIGIAVFYGKSWLLYHYLTFEPTRKGQLLTYQRKLIEGMSLV